MFCAKKTCVLQGSAGEKKDSGYLGGAPSNLGVNEAGVLIHNADEQPEAKKRHSRTVNLGSVPYSGRSLSHMFTRLFVL